MMHECCCYLASAVTWLRYQPCPVAKKINKNKNQIRQLCVFVTLFLYTFAFSQQLPFSVFAFCNCLFNCYWWSPSFLLGIKTAYPCTRDSQETMHGSTGWKLEDKASTSTNTTWQDASFFFIHSFFFGRGSRTVNRVHQLLLFCCILRE